MMMMINVWWCWECFYGHCDVSQMHKLWNVWWQKLFQTQYLVYHTYICTILTYVLEILGQIYKYSFSCTRYIQVYTKTFNLQIKEHWGCPWICLIFFSQMESIALKLHVHVLRLCLLIQTSALMITTTMVNDNPNYQTA